MDTSVLLVLIICAGVLGLLAGSRMRMLNRIVMFMVCYIIVCGLIAFYTGADFNTLLYAPIAPFFGGQNTTIMVEAGNLSVGNATTTLQMNGNTYLVTNASVTNGSAVGASWINGTVIDPSNPLNPVTAMMSALLLPFQSPWAWAFQFFIWGIMIWFIYNHFIRRREDWYDRDYTPPTSRSQSTPPQNPPPPQQTSPAQQQAIEAAETKEEKKPEKRDRYEVIKV